MWPNASQSYEWSFWATKDPVRPLGRTIFIFAHRQKAFSSFSSKYYVYQLSFLYIPSNLRGPVGLALECESYVRGFKSWPIFFFSRLLLVLYNICQALNM